MPAVYPTGVCNWPPLIQGGVRFRYSVGNIVVCCCILAESLLCLPAHAFDREQEGVRYRQWLRQLSLNLTTLDEQVPKTRTTDCVSAGSRASGGRG